MTRSSQSFMRISGLAQPAGRLASGSCVPDRISICPYVQEKEGKERLRNKVSLLQNATASSQQFSTEAFSQTIEDPTSQESRPGFVIPGT